jgi:UPF0271 protein
MISSIDINCDMGEGMLNDALIMPFISSANIACGFHAGDDQTMQRTIELAIEHNVAIGAHPSFPDKQNFGRTIMHLPALQLYDIVKEQIEILANITAHNNCKLHHVKAHGALYNVASNNEDHAQSICKAILSVDDRLVVYGLSGSKFIDVTRSFGLTAVSEVFADRTYQYDGSLTPRIKPNAVLQTNDAVKKQLFHLINGMVETVDGQTISIKAESICIHGDGGHAVEFASLINKTLSDNNFIINAP